MDRMADFEIMEEPVFKRIEFLRKLNEIKKVVCLYTNRISSAMFSP